MLRLLGVLTSNTISWMANWTLSELQPHIFTTPSSKYLFDYWIDHCDGLKKEFDYSHFLNPRVLLEDIIAESETNNLGNKNHREYFKGKIEEFTKRDKCFTRIVAAELSVLAEAITKGDSYNTILIAKQIIIFFQDRRYIEKLIEKLANLASATILKPDVKQEIKYYSRSLITELNYLGYEPEEIGRQIYEVFDDIVQRYDGLYTTSIPNNLPFVAPGSLTDIQMFVYNDGVRAFVNSLTIYERVKLLLSYVNDEEEEYIIQFSIAGLTALADDFSFANISLITFDSPEFLTSFISKAPPIGLGDRKKVFAQVKIKSLNRTLAVYSAHESLIRALKFMRFYETSKQSFSIAQEVMLFKNGDFIGNYNLPGHSPHLLDFEGMNLNYHRDEAFSLLYQSDFLNDIVRKQGSRESDQIFNSLHWYIKATENDSFREQILYSWISIESLMSYSGHVNTSSIVQLKDARKEEIILNYLPYLAIFEKFTTDTFQLYFYLYNLYESYSYLADGVRYRGLNLTDEQAEEVGYTSTGPRQITLIEVVELLKKISGFTSKQLVKDMIDEAISVYSTPEKAQEAIENIITHSKDGIHTIYRYRNQIAHNGKTSAKADIYVARMAKNYSRQLLRLVIEYKLKYPHSTIEEGIARTKIKIEVDLLRLKRNELVDAQQVRGWAVGEI